MAVVFEGKADALIGRVHERPQVVELPRQGDDVLFGSVAVYKTYGMSRVFDRGRDIEQAQGLAAHPGAVKILDRRIDTADLHCTHMHETR